MATRVNWFSASFMLGDLRKQACRSTCGHARRYATCEGRGDEAQRDLVALSSLMMLTRAAHLVFAGLTTKVYVQTSKREANDRGFECLLVMDATDSYFPRSSRPSSRLIVAQGAIVGWATPLARLKEALG